jgi:hypothetical protein
MGPFGRAKPAERLKVLLEENPTLRSVGLAWNDISGKSACTILEGCLANRTIKTLGELTAPSAVVRTVLHREQAPSAVTSRVWTSSY